MLQLAVTPALEAAARRALEAESLPRALRVELLGCLAERETMPPPDHDAPTAAVRGPKSKSIARLDKRHSPGWAA